MQAGFRKRGGGGYSPRRATWAARPPASEIKTRQSGGRLRHHGPVFRFPPPPPARHHGQGPRSLHPPPFVRQQPPDRLLRGVRRARVIHYPWILHQSLPDHLIIDSRQDGLHCQLPPRQSRDVRALCAPFCPGYPSHCRAIFASCRSKCCKSGRPHHQPNSGAR